MTFASQTEILDLRHFQARQLRPLLEQEAVLWQQRLRWDYGSSIELLLQYLDQQILPGFVALRGGVVCGYCFYVYEGTKAVIGDIFVLPDTPLRMEVTERLTRHLLEVLEASPDVDRIEAQLLLFDVGVLSHTFTERGFSIYPRLFLECELPECEPPEREPPGAFAWPEDVELCGWMAGFYQPSAELIHAAYVGHLDAEINDQYRTLHGSLRFLHNIVRFPGCGVFDAEGSWVLRHRQTNALLGVILCSQVAPGVAHVAQLCIATELRGLNLGRQLLKHCMAALAARGCAAVTLTVSEDNHAALSLYKAIGFTTRLRFEALVLQKHAASGRSLLKLLPGIDEAPDLTSVARAQASETSGLFSFARRKTTPARR